MTEDGDRLHIVTNDDIPARRKAFGRTPVCGSGVILLLVAMLQTLDRIGTVEIGFAT